MQAAIGCCILLLYTSAQDDLDPRQLALVVFILPSINTKTSLALACTGGVFLVPNSAFTNVHT